MKVRDLMTEDPYTVTESESALALYDLMGERQFRHVPVVDDDGQLVGLVSHRDLLRNTFATGDLPVTNQRMRLERVSADEIMVPDPETVDPDQPLREAAQTMLDNKFGCLPVVDGDELVGILTESDFVRYFAEQD